MNAGVLKHRVIGPLLYVLVPSTPEFSMKSDNNRVFFVAPWLLFDPYIEVITGLIAKVATKLPLFLLVFIIVFWYHLPSNIKYRTRLNMRQITRIEVVVPSFSALLSSAPCTSRFHIQQRKSDLANLSQQRPIFWVRVVPQVQESFDPLPV